MYICQTLLLDLVKMKTLKDFTFRLNL